MSWRGKLYVCHDKTGHGHVCTVPPKMQGRVEAFQVVGPFIPITAGKPVSVGDARAWMTKLGESGFDFEPCSVEMDGLG